METVKVTNVLTMRARIIPRTNTICTCGDCGRSWDDAIVTGVTPTPAGRCPFEHLHKAPKRAKVPTVLEALETLLELCAHVPVFQLDNGKASVLAVRRAGKFNAAVNNARAAVAKQKGQS